MNSPRVMCRSLRLCRNEIEMEPAETEGGRAKMCRSAEKPSTKRSESLDGSAFYRRHTEGMLRRYVRMSMQIGRVPSCLPREYLRTRSSSRQGANFEDGVIFVHDMEQCLEKLDKMAALLVARIGIQEYSRREAAEMLGLSHGQLARSYDEAIDQLTRILLLHQLIREGGNESQTRACL
jgi:hypothetical protein